MSDLVVLPLSEYRYLQLVQRIGPFESPIGGPDRVSADYLIERGLLELVGGQVAVTLLGAVAVAAEAREVDGNAVAIERSLLDECQQVEESRAPSDALSDSRCQPGAAEASQVSGFDGRGRE